MTRMRRLGPNTYGIKGDDGVTIWTNYQVTSDVRVVFWQDQEYRTYVERDGKTIEEMFTSEFLDGRFDLTNAIRKTMIQHIEENGRVDEIGIECGYMLFPEEGPELREVTKRASFYGVKDREGKGIVMPRGIPYRGGEIQLEFDRDGIFYLGWKYEKSLVWIREFGPAEKFEQMLEETKEVIQMLLGEIPYE